MAIQQKTRAKLLTRVKRRHICMFKNAVQRRATQIFDFENDPRPRQNYRNISKLCHTRKRIHHVAMIANQESDAYFIKYACGALRSCLYDNDQIWEKLQTMGNNPEALGAGLDIHDRIWELCQYLGCVWPTAARDLKQNYEEIEKKFVTHITETIAPSFPSIEQLEHRSF